MQRDRLTCLDHKKSAADLGGGGRRDAGPTPSPVGIIHKELPPSIVAHISCILDPIHVTILHPMLNNAFGASIDLHQKSL